MAASVPGDDSPLCARSVVSEGDTARTQHALAKARRGEAVTVGVIGGSITAGAAASSPEKNYGSLVARWWRETFPKAKVDFVNAGIGATGSNYGALRAQRDLLSRRPDFVVVEFAVNDPNDRTAAETLEGLIRQILKQPNQPAPLVPTLPRGDARSDAPASTSPPPPLVPTLPRGDAQSDAPASTFQPAVMQLFTMNRQGANAQEWHSKVGAHYGLPMVSFRDAVWPEIQAGRMKWEEVEADEVHPNDRGHATMARLVTAVLEKALQVLPEDGRLAAVKPIPAPLLSDLFEHVVLFEADALKPTANQGWTYDGKSPWAKGWKSEVPGSVIEFEVEGQVILLTEWHIRGPMGRARVQVDDLAPATVEAWFEPTWGGWRCTHEIARGLKPGRHRVRVELLEEKSPQSAGHEFRLLGIGAAGVEGGR